MREIKYRAWNKDKNKMSEVFSIGKLINGFNTEGNWSEYEDDDLMDFNYECGEDYEPMQYTGLKDKNGKEIYEGDILKVNETAGDIVSLLEGGGDMINFDITGVVEYDTEGADFQITTRDEEDIRGFTDDQIREVIGNIYENPELLSNHTPSTGDKL